MTRCWPLPLERDVAILRLYSWSQPTLSLGYFQAYDDRLDHLESNGLELVRRGTGGGAIVHHYDWTYSIALPASALPGTVGAAQPLYDCVHDAVVAWLRKGGFDARKWIDSGDRSDCSGSGCSFLCFERRSVGDVVIGGDKVMGSAQRRLRGALLQHGSLLLQQSEHAPSLPGLQELCVASGKAWLAPAIGPFFDQLCERLAGFLATTISGVENVDAILEHKVHNGKYETEAWNRKR